MRGSIVLFYVLLYTSPQALITVISCVFGLNLFIKSALVTYSNKEIKPYKYTNHKLFTITSPRQGPGLSGLSLVYK